MSTKINLTNDERNAVVLAMNNLITTAQMMRRQKPKEAPFWNKQEDQAKGVLDKIECADMASSIADVIAQMKTT